MARRKKKSRRTRLSKDEIRRKSASTGTGSGNWFKLPDGVDTWEPKKAGKYLIDILPYETTSEHHPNDIASGAVWYRYPFKIHHGLGVDNKSIVCPTSVGMKCPVCEEIGRLSKDYDDNKSIIKGLRAQRYVAYNILNPDDTDNVSILALSVGKFFNLLEQELEESDVQDITNFFDVTEDGKTLRVRFSDASYQGRKYLEATKIDFKNRDEMDEEEIFKKVVNLDEMFVVLDYKKLQALFLQVEVEEEEELGGEEECVACSGTGKSSKGRRCVPCKGSGKVDRPDDDSDSDSSDISSSSSDSDNSSSSSGSWDESSGSWDESSDALGKKKKAKKKEKKTTTKRKPLKRNRAN